MQRPTYALINGNILKENIIEIKKNYPEYEYYIGVVKNDAYHHGIYVINDLIKGGVNYLAISSLEEAIKVRKINKNIPILCLEVILLDYLDLIIKYNITITIESLTYLKKLLAKDFNGLIKVHLAVDSGMHRLGFDSKKNLTEAFYLLKESKNLFLEGIYSHFATSGIKDPYYDYQLNKFIELTNDIHLEEIPIVHLGRSRTLVEHKKPNFCNGIRLGIVMYGFNQSLDINYDSLKGKYQFWKIRKMQKKFRCSPTTITNCLKVKPAYILYSQIMSRRKVKVGDFVGYNANYFIKTSGYIYTICIGYADGVDKKFDYVLINSKKCKIVADCMDMLLVFSQNKYEVGCKVEIFGEQRSIKDVCRTLNINAYHLFNQISNRVTKVYVNKDKIKEI